MPNAQPVAPEPPVPRIPWIAALLTVPLAGLGHLYAGAPRRALAAWLLAFVTIMLVFPLAVALPTQVGFAVPWVLLLSLEAALITDAVRTARRASPTFVPRPYNRWYVYVCLIFFSGQTLHRPLKSFIERHIYRAYRIPSESMAPTILVGDHLYATPLRGAIHRGDNVIYPYSGKTFVKRVIGLPGDTLSMNSDSLWINGRRVPEPYMTPSSDVASPTSVSRHPTMSTWGPVVVPAHSYFVMGDNRGSSLDSRYFGFVNADSVSERPLGIYFSRDPVSGSIRWKRLGASVER